MKKFRFRLERVLEYRKLVKDEKVKALIGAQNELYEAQEKLRELEAASLEDLFDGVEMTVERIQMNDLYRERLKNDIERQKSVIVEAEKKVEEARSIYIEAAQEEESLSLLKAKKEAEYTEYIEKEEFNNLDEMTVQRQGRNRLKL